MHTRGYIFKIETMKLGVIIFLMLVSCSAWKKYSWNTTTFEYILSILPQEQKDFHTHLTITHKCPFYVRGQ